MDNLKALRSLLASEQKAPAYTVFSDASLADMVRRLPKTLDDFLDFVTPQYALLSVAGSSRSLPGAETLERLDSRGIAYFRTDECGDITLAVEDGALTITPYLERKSP